MVFSNASYAWADGFYNGRNFDSEARRRIRPLGATVYGKYRISRGDFPIYEDESFTNTGGQAKVGVVLSLLRDRAFDEARFRERDADLAVRAAQLEVLLTRVGVQQQALEAYWRWVTAGHQLEVYEELLNIAQDREVALEKQVESGARATIFLTEKPPEHPAAESTGTRRPEGFRDFGAAPVDVPAGWQRRAIAGRPHAAARSQRRQQQ